MMIDEYFLLPDGTPTTLAAVSPILAEVPMWQAYPGDSLNGDFTNCFAPNRRGLEVALHEAQFKVEAARTVSMGGYFRATAIEDERVAKYQQLDWRLESTPFDPTIPYFLDEARCTPLHRPESEINRRGAPSKSARGGSSGCEVPERVDDGGRIGRTCEASGRVLRSPRSPGQLATEEDFMSATRRLLLSR
jgi:hypothetical protein